mgnify:FL=1
MIAALLIVFGGITEHLIPLFRHRGLWIGLGILGGLSGSALLALFANEIASTFEGSGQDILNAAILSIAVVMLVWTVVWMASHGRQMVAEMKDVGSDVKEGRRPLAALAIVVGMAVLREGVEIVLFLYGIATTGDETVGAVVLGGLAGLACGAVVSLALYRGLVAIPLRHLFKVTTIIITLLAAGLAAQAVGILQDSGFIQSLSDPLWNTNWLLADDSALGRVLRTLVGYRAEPTGMQLIAYLGTVATIVVLSSMVNGRRSPAAGAPRQVRA